MSRVVIRVALDPSHWRANDKAAWAMHLALAAEMADPSLLAIEGYEITDTLVHIRMRSDEHVKALRKRLRDDDSIKRLRARLADLGGRPDFEIEDER
ncbi:MAG: hypothetical protein ABUL55_00730 [Pseudomonadota bacterium]